MTVRELREAMAKFDADERVYLWYVSDSDSELIEVDDLERHSDRVKKLEKVLTIT